MQARTEAEVWPDVVKSWEGRVREMNLRPNSKAYSDQQLAFLQGVISALSSAGIMTNERVGSLAFMCMVGRADAILTINQSAAQAANQGE